MYKNQNAIKKKNICNEYRKSLDAPNLTEKEVEEIRHNLKLVATAICEHVWKKKVY